jgi:hypothetical protein
VNETTRVKLSVDNGVTQLSDDEMQVMGKSLRLLLSGRNTTVAMLEVVLSQPNGITVDGSLAPMLSVSFMSMVAMGALIVVQYRKRGGLPHNETWFFYVLVCACAMTVLMTITRGMEQNVDACRASYFFFWMPISIIQGWVTVIANHHLMFLSNKSTS